MRTNIQGAVLIIAGFTLLCFACGCQTLKSYSDYKQKHDAKCECAWTCPPAWGEAMGGK
jgi:hypothetical protein